MFFMITDNIRNPKSLFGLELADSPFLSPHFNLLCKSQSTAYAMMFWLVLWVTLFLVSSDPTRSQCIHNFIQTICIFMCSFSLIPDIGGEMQYTVLWLPSRYRQLYSYIFFLVATPVIILSRVLLLRWYSYRKISGQASR